MRKFFDKVNPRKAPAKYCIFKPLSTFSESEEPEFVVFFARPEVLCGLFTHTTFTTGEVDSVASPFGAGCTNIVAWPLFYKEQRVEKAVLGGFDPSARKFMKTDELTFTVPPFHGAPPDLETYRSRRHRRLDTRTYGAKCITCIWGCRMPVKIIIDRWNPSKKQYRFETFCYGPKSCTFYNAGPKRKVPGRQGMSYTEEYWVDEDVTAYRGPDD